MSDPIASPRRFSDLSNHWAQGFIEGLAARGLVSGLPNGTFAPDRPLSRVEWAVLITNSFNRPKVREAIEFKDIAATFWGRAAIRRAGEMGFLGGFPDGTFRPGAQIERSDLLLSLVNGLGLTGGKVAAMDLPAYFDDWAAIPAYARSPVAIATGRHLVANFPNRRQLRPRFPASRAEAASALYQALRLGQDLPAINSPALVLPSVPAPPVPTPPSPTPVPTPPPATVRLSHRRELRAAWVASVWNINWPSKPGLPSDQQQAELVRLLDRAAANQLNAIFLQIRPEGDALYDSKIEPWSRWLTGTQGKAPQPYYDPLAFAIAECRKRNLELHAWFNPYRARSTTNSLTSVGGHVEAVYPEAVYTYGTLRWMDPGRPEIQNRAVQVVLDVLTRYDVDGIHLDDYFYPYPKEGIEFPDRETYWQWGGGLSIGDWRRKNVNDLVQRLSERVRATKPWVKFGISPFGIYRPGQPAGILGLDQYALLYADPKRWLNAGWLDYIAPQLYWRNDQTAQSYNTLLKWWTDQVGPNCHVYPGNNLDQLGSSASWSLGEFEQQIELTRALASRQALGNIFYSIDPLVENRQGITDRLRSSTYASPALPPVLKTGTPPPVPTGLTVQGKQVTWSASSLPAARGWALYRRSASSQQWTIVRLLPLATTSTTLEAGNYALAAVDRTGRESEGIAFTVN